MSGRHLWARLSFIRDTLLELSPTYLAGTKPFGNHQLSSWKNYVYNSHVQALLQHRECCDRLLNQVWIT